MSSTSVQPETQLSSHSASNEFKLALRLLMREARSGELSLILVSLVLAVTVATAIAVFSQRLENAMSDNASALLGADLRVESSSPIPADWEPLAKSLDLATAKTLTFPSMTTAGESLALSSIKAVDAGYPLAAELKVRRSDNGSAALMTQGPAAGEAWVEPRLLALLHVELGDQMTLGSKALTITGVIEKESDRGGNFYSLSPRALIHWDDAINNDLLGPGSRVEYRLLLQGPATALTAFQRSVDLAENQNFEALGGGNRTMARALARAQRYLALAATLAVVLASIAVAISARHYSERHYDTSALMRTFGLSSQAVLRLFTWQLLVLGALAALIGGAAAWCMQWVLEGVLAGVVPTELPTAGWVPWSAGMSTGIISLLGFALPQLLPLAAVSPLRVLRRDLVPVPARGWIITALALGALTLLMWFLTGDLAVSALLIGGGAVVSLLLLLFIRGALAFTAARLRNRDLSLTIRFVWLQLSRQPALIATQILAFALTLMVMLVLANLRNDLLADWQRSLPDQAPNVFALNIQANQVDAFTATLRQQDIEPQTLYPMVPLRLVAINGTNLVTLGLDRVRSIDRDLITSDAQSLPANNRIVAGAWAETQAGPSQVSVEAELATTLGLELGDTLTFKGAGQTFDARISSLRTVDWTAMTPNFYMMLSPDLLDEIPFARMTSFFLDDTQGQALTQLVRAFPGITFLDIGFLLGQVQSLLAQLSLAVELILLFVLVGALLVMFAVLVTSTRARLRQGAVLRTLGTSRQQLQRAQQLEFCVTGGIVALLALAGAELICWGLYRLILDIPYTGLGWVWLWLPPLVMSGLTLAAMGALRRIVRASPLQVLRFH